MMLITCLFTISLKDGRADEGCALSAECAVCANAPDLESRQVGDPHCDDDNPGDESGAQPSQGTNKTGTAR